MISVNAKTITENEVLAEMQYHPAENQRQALLKAAETLVIAELLRQRARELKLAVEENKDRASESDFIETLIEREVDYPKASDAECEQFYRANPQRFISSPLLEVSHILLAAAPSDDEGRLTAKARAQKLLLTLLRGENFAALARKESDCPSGLDGGHLGQIGKGQTVPEFDRQVFNAGQGLLKYLVESRYGFHLVLIHRREEGKVLPFDDKMRETIRDYLNEKVSRKAISQYIHRLVAAADIDGYDFGVSESPLMQ